MATSQPQPLPDYEQLFGSQNYLACEPCQSIFSAAAYFADLMRIVDEYITTPNSRTITTSKSGTIPKGYSLKERRPDLFTLLLTCANTNDTEPYTKIVNEALKALLKEQLGSDALLALATAQYPFNLPYNEPLARISHYLDSLKTSLPEIYQTFNPSNPYDLAWAQASLGLSPGAYNIIVTPASSSASKLPAYGDVTASAL